jgi:hypothetical protein
MNTKATERASGPHPLDAAVARVRGWAYTDSLLDLDKGKLRELLASDIETTGTALPNEFECSEMICGLEDRDSRPCNEGGIPLDLIARFPATHAWLEEQWA